MVKVKRRMFTPEEVEEIREFYESHKWYGYSGVARKYDCHPWTVSQIVNRTRGYAD